MMNHYAFLVQEINNSLVKYCTRPGAKWLKEGTITKRALLCNAVTKHKKSYCVLGSPRPNSCLLLRRYSPVF